MKTASELIREAVGSWPGVTTVPHRFGGTEYLFGKKEMGHVHGDRLVDMPLPRRLRDEMIASGRAQPHHVLPETGWVSVWIDGPHDVAGVIELFRMQYDRYTEKRALNASGGAPSPSSV
ncbi:MAG: hypothetical protein E6I12_02150 [Chloroflexi bacterium]|nr:MAG: hypothetical protein E6I15_07885 [Chloroflexota bacterium]TMF79523.1 MAG: hypothetical protein E6I12_02150 [Chloroflexota bacterium]TMF96698.1 MAG: hypothetical protein E6I05_00530 [Chloroflexota bacterium]TMG46342.1 MAG: hypothetical protein E6H85_01555 [Chloroflexota bacterium]